MATVIGQAATVSSWALFFAPMYFIIDHLSYRPSIKEINSKKNVGKYSYLPFFSIVFNCTAWVIYGCSKWDKAVIYTNLPGIFLGMIYSYVYYRYSPDKSKFLTLHKGYLILTLLLGLSYFLLPKNISQTFLGLVANCGSISVFGAPLSKLKDVVISKSTEGMPLCMCICNMIVSTLWTLYGHIVKDWFIIFPNLCGMILAMIQLLLFVIFPVRTPRYVKVDNV